MDFTLHREQREHFGRCDGGFLQRALTRRLTKSWTVALISGNQLAVIEPTTPFSAAKTRFSIYPRSKKWTPQRIFRIYVYAYTHFSSRRVIIKIVK
jgi:hypothetical protein